MKTAAAFSSGFVTCLAAVSIACDGGDYSEVQTDTGTATTAGVCKFASTEDMERAIEAGVICRVFEAGTREEA